MSELTLYHNPHCSKSRSALELLRARGVEPRVVEYLVTPPDEATLRAILGKLGLRARDLVRQHEPAFRELGLDARGNDDEALLRAMLEFPVLIERPILVRGTEACLGRPPKRVLELL